MLRAEEVVIVGNKVVASHETCCCGRNTDTWHPKRGVYAALHVLAERDIHSRGRLDLRSMFDGAASNRGISCNSSPITPIWASYRPEGFARDSTCTPQHSSLLFQVVRLYLMRTFLVAPNIRQEFCGTLFVTGLHRSLDHLESSEGYSPAV